MDQSHHLAHPRTTRLVVGRPGEKVRLVSQIPHPYARMVAQLANDGRKEQLLRGQCRSVAEKVPVSAIH